MHHAAPHLTILRATLILLGTFGAVGVWTCALVMIARAVQKGDS